VDYWWDYETIRETTRLGRKHQENKRLPLYDFDFSDFLGIIPEMSCQTILLTVLIGTSHIVD
jgi:hypothetical protein